MTKTISTRKNLYVNEFSQRDASIIFEEEGHKYFIHGKEDYISVTTLIHKFFPEFQKFSISLNKAKKDCSQLKHKLSNKELEKEILKKQNAYLHEWEKKGEEACRLGTLLHNRIECFYNDEFDVNFEDFCEIQEEFQAFLKFDIDFCERGFKPYRSEWQVYDEEFKIVGSIDQLFYTGDDTTHLTMVDWKRCKQISSFAFKNEKGFGTFFYLSNANSIHYSLQQNVYKYILEKRYGKKIDAMFLLHINPKTKKETLIPIPDMQREVINFLYLFRSCTWDQ